jgi:hypothetical protein
MIMLNQNRRHILRCFAGFSVLGVPAAQAKYIVGDKSFVIKFSKGSSSAKYSGHVEYYDTHTYKFKAHAGQKITIDFTRTNPALNFTLSDLAGEKDLAFQEEQLWSGELPSEGAYEIVVALMRSAARRNEAADYKLTMIIG